jgi:hypothetical protein
MIKAHTFHIPVMGTGFTVDTPLRVSQYGIDSVISLVDDILLEKMRAMYCKKFGLVYDEITESIEDYRAKRITSYLNLINSLAKKKFDEIKSCTIEKSNEIKEYVHLLPDSSTIKQKFRNLSDEYFDWEGALSWLKEHLSMGSIDVNIMTKLDKDNYKKNEKLPIEFNDAHAALRGFANSELESSLILSAGMNPKLYGYLENFEDFYPDENGQIKKKIVIKVSDYRSAFIQGKFLAKKGLWISEYRIESGLNCGGHAFATDGYLMGPILAEFKANRKELIQSNYDLMLQALSKKNRPLPSSGLSLKITAQGGVGTAEEHQFLLDYYELDSIGWGSPFLLVPEVTNVDEETLSLLEKATEDDLYLSEISPLGVPFNSLKGNTKDRAKLMLVDQGRPGSSCPKKFLVSNSDYSEKKICTASRQYQHIKLKELDEKSLPPAEHKQLFDQIVDKSCICVGLGSSALIVNNLEPSAGGPGVSVCPGPNIAYFSKKMSLKEMIDHIYGRAFFARTDRPNLFIKELELYISYLKNKVEKSVDSMSAKQKEYYLSFVKNLNEGINYYFGLFNELKDVFQETKHAILNGLDNCKKNLDQLSQSIERLKTE